jgi:hypothetical protein
VLTTAQTASASSSPRALRAVNVTLNTRVTNVIANPGDEVGHGTHVAGNSLNRAATNHPGW